MLTSDANNKVLNHAGESKKFLLHGFDRIYFFVNGILNEQMSYARLDQHGIEIEPAERPLKICLFYDYTNTIVDSDRIPSSHTTGCEIHALPNSCVNIMELHLAAQTNVSTEIKNTTKIRAEKNSTVEFLQIIKLNDLCNLQNELELRLLSQANINCTQLQLRAQEVHNHIQGLLMDEGSDFKHQLLVTANDKQNIITKSTIEHVKGFTTSDQIVRNVLFDQSQMDFQGQLKIHEGAQKSAAKQYCHSLLMGQESGAKVQPQLEVLADDVQAAHGATVGRLREEEIFYLQSRAIDRIAAEKLLSFGFQSEIVGKMNNDFLKEKAKQSIELPLDALIEEAY